MNLIKHIKKDLQNLGSVMKTDLFECSINYITKKNYMFRGKYLYS